MGKKMKVLVTGAKGFLGSRLIQKMIEKKYLVVAISRSEIPNYLKDEKNISWVKFDLSDKTISFKDTINVDSIIHLAGRTLGAKISESEFIESNESTLCNLLSSNSINSKKIIFSSSQVVYGGLDSISIKETDNSGEIDSAYAASKVNAENWLRWYQKKLEIPAIALRFSGFIEGGGLIDYIINQSMSNNDIDLYSNGEVCRDYLPVTEGIHSIISTIEKPFSIGFHAINIGSGEVKTTKTLAEIIKKKIGSSSKIVLSNKQSDRANCILNISKANQHLNFKPKNLVKNIENYAQSILDAYENKI